MIRVRFAPSPTGSLHLGGLRSAFYNYIFAKQNNGSFVLRIEDTDKKRLVPGAAEEIERSLVWAGLTPDESPSLGGQYGPYMQSLRLKLYQDRAHELIESGKAYRCFCSPNRLELLRKSQSRNREKPHYDGKCRKLSPAEVKEKLGEHGSQFAIRFALQPGITTFDDTVFGNISNDLVTNNESDPVIIKSDNYPTYHFANVVDDHLMRISHVLRGSEWLASTCKHIQIYQAFNWSQPKFIHLPLISMADGSKMSKRNDQSRLDSWINSGYRPLALLNFLTNSGGGVPKSKQDLMELWSLTKLIENFDFDRVTSHAATLNLDRLRIYNSKDIGRVWEESPELIIKEFRKILSEKRIKCDLRDSELRTIIQTFIGRITTLYDLVSNDNSFIWALPELTWSTDEYQDEGWNLKIILEDFMEGIKNMDREDKGALGEVVNMVVNKHAIDRAAFYKFVRKTLTNSTSGLPIHDIFQSLGRGRFLLYLESGLNYVR